MSEELKKKLFNYEVNPPGNAWAKIVDALEEEINAQFPHKLYEAETAPPTNAWSNIVSALESSRKEEYADKLYNLEVSPPVDAWQNISGALHEEHDVVPTISPRRKIAPIVRFAVAASVIAIVAFGALKLLNQKANDRGIAGNTVAPKKTLPTTVQPLNEQTPSVQSVPVLSNNLPKERLALARPKTISRKKPITNQSSYMTQTPDMAYAVNSSPAYAFQEASLRGDVPGNCPLITDADRYLNFMNPDGSLVRISKKLADAVGCYYNNGTSDEYKQCQEQMKRWRDKITQSSSAPSTDNFMDVLDIIKSAQDKEM
jgi:negative regulator of sigma E activity